MVLNFVVFLQRASAKIRSLPMALWNKPSRVLLWVDKPAQALRWTTEQQLEPWRCAHCQQTPPCPGIGSQTALGHECRHAHPAWTWAAVSHSPNRPDLHPGPSSGSTHVWCIVQRCPHQRKECSSSQRRTADSWTAGKGGCGIVPRWKSTYHSDSSKMPTNCLLLGAFPLTKLINTDVVFYTYHTLYSYNKLKIRKGYPGNHKERKYIYSPVLYLQKQTPHVSRPMHFKCRVAQGSSITWNQRQDM